MTNKEAIEYASAHSFQGLYEKGFNDGRAVAILNQCNHDEAMKDCLREYTERLHSAISNRGACDIHDVINQMLNIFIG